MRKATKQKISREIVPACVGLEVQDLGAIDQITSLSLRQYTIEVTDKLNDGAKNSTVA